MDPLLLRTSVTVFPLGVRVIFFGGPELPVPNVFTVFNVVPERAAQRED